MTLGPLGFTTPWILAALILLPLLWVILRAVPPAPVRRRFPGVTLLLGLKDPDSVTDRTPWWLLLLKVLALTALIVGLSGPVLNPAMEPTEASKKPLLLVLDGAWTGARDWQIHAARAEELLAEAGRNGRPVAVLRLTTPETPVFQDADTWRRRIGGLEPQPWEPSVAMMQAAADALGDKEFDTVWMSDGLARDGRNAFLSSLESHGSVRIEQGGQGVMALLPPTVDGAVLTIAARRLVADLPQSVTVVAHGRDPSGFDRILSRIDLTFAAGDTDALAEVALPAELRARITQFAIAQTPGAGAVMLSGTQLRRPEVALIAGHENREGLELLAQLHYLRQALAPSSDVLEGALTDLLPANPDAIFLADVARLSDAEQEGLIEWAKAGGTLVRFAGPRLAASAISRRDEAPLMPVRLREGGRSVGGAMSWGAPKSLAPFAENSPFYGLAVPDDVRIRAQVLAQPDPTLADRVIAQLGDGTPLVTRKRIGQGQVVLFHISANAEWSSLPLSGLFVGMLERLINLTPAENLVPEDLAGSTWVPIAVLDGMGQINSSQTLTGVEGASLLSAPIGPDLRPGIYQDGDRVIVRNAMTEDRVFGPVSWPLGTQVAPIKGPKEQQLGGWLLGLALLALAVDVFATIALSGRLRSHGAQIAAVIAIVIAVPLPAKAQAVGQSADALAIAASSQLVLAHVRTTDDALDKRAYAGLVGLGDTLAYRTSVEPGPPVAIDLETDELSLFPLIYWPVTPAQPMPSANAYAKLNNYLRSGGMILFDTRDADLAGFGTASENGRKLQQLARSLDIPPLEQVPDDHVLTRSFYLLKTFPGRYDTRDVWVEAAPPDAEQVEGMPFRNLNDGVTPVLIGGNDWASAWAQDERGNALYPVGRGLGGQRQRELAYRFGVNLVMYVLTGNYKSDQVHVPALLERLGQ